MPAKRRAKPKRAKPTSAKTRRRPAIKPIPRNDLRAQLAQQRSLEALYLMRSKGLSLAQAARAAHTTPRTVQRRVSNALKRADDGRYTATKFDRIPRTLNFITERGIVVLTVRDSRTASLIARYISAVHKYLRTGDRRPLWPFRGKSIRAGKITYPFITNPETLDRLAYAGEVVFEDLYALTTGERK